MRLIQCIVLFAMLYCIFFLRSIVQKDIAMCSVNGLGLFMEISLLIINLLFILICLSI